MVHSKRMARIRKLRKAESKKDPFKTGESFTTLNNLAAREAEHHALLNNMGFPSEQPLEGARYQRYSEHNSDDDSPDGVNHNIPYWVVNEASEMIYDIPDDGAPSFKGSAKAKSRAKENTMDVKKSGIIQRQVKLMKQDPQPPARKYGTNPLNTPGSTSTASQTAGAGMEGDVGSRGVKTSRTLAPSSQQSSVTSTTTPTPTLTQPGEINTGSGTAPARSGGGTPPTTASSGTPTQAGFGFNRQRTSPTSGTPGAMGGPEDDFSGSTATTASGQGTPSNRSSYLPGQPNIQPTSTSETMEDLRTRDPAGAGDEGFRSGMQGGREGLFYDQPRPDDEGRDGRGRFDWVGDAVSGFNQGASEFKPWTGEGQGADQMAAAGRAIGSGLDATGSAISDAAGATPRGIMGPNRYNDAVTPTSPQPGSQEAYDMARRQGLPLGSKARYDWEQDQARVREGEIGLMEKSLTKRLIKLQKSQGRMRERRGL